MGNIYIIGIYDFWNNMNYKIISIENKIYSSRIIHGSVFTDIDQVKHHCNVSVLVEATQRDGTVTRFKQNFDPQWTIQTWSKFFRKNVSGLDKFGSLSKEEKNKLKSLWEKFLIEVGEFNKTKTYDIDLIKQANAISKRKMGYDRRIKMKGFETRLQNYLSNLQRDEIKMELLPNDFKSRMLTVFLTEICASLNDEEISIAWSKAKTEIVLTK